MALISSSLAVFALLLVPPALSAREAGYDYYPAAIAALGETDWLAMRAELDRIGTTDDSGVPGQVRAGYLLARIARVPWPDDQRREIAGHLITFAQRLLALPGLDGADRPIGSLPARAIWCHGEIVRQLDPEGLFAVWTEAVRASRSEVRLQVISVCSRLAGDASIPPLLERLRTAAGTALAAAEQQALDLVLLRHDLLALSDQQGGWERMWARVPERSLAAVRTSAFAMQWYRQLVVFRTVHVDADPAIPLALADPADQAKAYAFLYAAAFLANASQGTDKPASQAVMAQILTAEAGLRARLDPMPEGVVDWLAESIKTLRAKQAQVPGP